MVLEDPYNAINLSSPRSYHWHEKTPVPSNAIVPVHNFFPRWVPTP